MRSVVLTGVSRGLGAALFAALTGRGDRVFAIGRQFTADQRALAAKDPDRIRLYGADLTDPASLPDAGELNEFLLGESVLILNAAVVGPLGAIGKLARDQVASAVTVNLTAPMLLTDAFLAARPAGQDTRVLFISSGAAHRVIEYWSVYSTTKRGMEMFIDAVAVQEPDAYVVNVNPGVMDTDMQVAVRASDFPERERYVGLHERGELPDPVEIAQRIIDKHIDQPITGE
jgi:NAD(P)-dependent dehydrogenase (short-subunit alcohol dehydrogenase family)